MPQETISGKITDANTMPLPGASIVVKGMAVGTVTDFDGNFSINLPDGKTVLEITYLGYQPQEIDVSGKQNVAITLEEDSAQLDAVVVTALGIKKEKKRLGYSVQEVEGELDKARNVNFLNGLSGKVSGLVIAQSPEFFQKPKYFPSW